MIFLRYLSVKIHQDWRILVSKVEFPQSKLDCYHTIKKFIERFIFQSCCVASIVINFIVRISDSTSCSYLYSWSKGYHKNDIHQIIKYARVYYESSNNLRKIKIFLLPNIIILLLFLL